jgi:hypothetical protein
MSTVTDHGLVCLDGEDYAALALALQADALAVEASLSSVQAAFTRFRQRPTVLATTTAGIVAVASGGETPSRVGTWAVSYSNFTPVPTVVPFSGVRITIPATGLYSYGGYINLVASGAVTALSRRTVYANASRVVSGVTTLLSQVVWRTVDTGTGGEFLTVTGGSFYATVGTVVDVQVLESHGNLASGINCPAGSRLWCHFIGSNVEIGSV